MLLKDAVLIKKSLTFLENVFSSHGQSKNYILHGNVCYHWALLEKKKQDINGKSPRLELNRWNSWKVCQNLRKTREFTWGGWSGKFLKFKEALGKIYWKSSGVNSNRDFHIKSRKKRTY